jgi:hypothetical protein
MKKTPTPSPGLYQNKFPKSKWRSKFYLLQQRKIDGAVSLLSKTTTTRHKLRGIRVRIIRTSLERTTRRRRCIATKLGRMHKSGIRHTIQQQKIVVPIQREFGGIQGKVLPGDKSTVTCRHGRVRKGNRFVVVVYRLHSVGSGLRYKIEST